MTPDELEQRTDRRLRALPLPRAPHTLVPRVMEAVRILAGRPWYARTWFTWPLGGQMLSAGIVLSDPERRKQVLQTDRTTILLVLYAVTVATPLLVSLARPIYCLDRMALRGSARAK